jgi:ribosome-associated heat shock protein Hsp15
MTMILKERIRVDKWLWHARFFKSRTLAAKLAGSGKLRINREIVRKPGGAVKIGDVLTFPKGTDIRVIEILALGERRGPASEAQEIYKDLSPPRRQVKEPSVAERPRGAGRPTKSERRALDRFRERAG